LVRLRHGPRAARGRGSGMNLPAKGSGRSGARAAPGRLCWNDSWAGERVVAHRPHLDNVLDMVQQQQRGGMKKSSKHLKRRGKIRLVMRKQTQHSQQPKQTSQPEAHDLGGTFSLSEVLRSLPKDAKVTLTPPTSLLAYVQSHLKK
jgi:hypothetical protein